MAPPGPRLKRQAGLVACRELVVGIWCVVADRVVALGVDALARILGAGCTRDAPPETWRGRIPFSSADKC
jgi:hypothetical protein